ncbi:MAG: hypothetical protein RR310_01000 [Eubacterium sp.]
MKIVKQHQSFYMVLILGVALMFCLFGCIFFGKAGISKAVMGDSAGKVSNVTFYQEDGVSRLERQMKQENIKAMIITTDAVAACLINNRIQ